MNNPKFMTELAERHLNVNSWVPKPLICPTTGLQASVAGDELFQHHGCRRALGPRRPQHQRRCGHCVDKWAEELSHHQNWGQISKDKAHIFNARTQIAADLSASATPPQLNTDWHEV